MVAADASPGVAVYPEETSPVGRRACLHGVFQGLARGRSGFPDYTLVLQQTAFAMPFAANLSFLFTERPFPQRFAAAAASRTSDTSFLRLAGRRDRRLAGPSRAGAGALQLAARRLLGGGGAGWPACPGARGIRLKGRANPFTMPWPRLPAGACLAGLRRRAPEAELEAVYLANLRHRCADHRSLGLTVTIRADQQPHPDMPRLLARHAGPGLELQARIDRANVAVQYDIYHAQIMVAGDLAHTLRPPPGASATSRSRTTWAATNRGRGDQLPLPVRTFSTAWATLAGWAASTSPGRQPRPGLEVVQGVALTTRTSTNFSFHGGPDILRPGRALRQTGVLEEGAGQRLVDSLLMWWVSQP